MSEKFAVGIIRLGVGNIFRVIFFNDLVKSGDLFKLGNLFKLCDLLKLGDDHIIYN